MLLLCCAALCHAALMPATGVDAMLHWASSAPADCCTVETAAHSKPTPHPNSFTATHKLLIDKVLMHVAGNSTEA
jgi:hypothetical protein